MPCAAALARYPATPRPTGVSFMSAAFGAAAAYLPAMAPMHVRRAMLGGGYFALPLTLRCACGLAFDFQRIVDRLFRIGARSYISGRGLTVGCYRCRRGCEHRVVDDLAACADEALVGGDQGHIRIDEDPTVAGRHLGVEMQMIAGAAGLAAVIADGPEHFALDDFTSADHAGGIEHLRVHVQVAKADVLAGLVDHEIKRVVAGRAHDNAVGDRDDIFLIGIAAPGALDMLQAKSRPDILALVAEPGWTLADVIIAVLAKIIAPRIGIILRFVGEQRLVVDPAAVGRILVASAKPDTPGEIAIAPIHERLRVCISRRLRHGKADFGIDGG